MTRCVAVLALGWMLVGCRAPAPTFNLMAPYGPATIPPPRTGAVGTGGPYYAPGTLSAPPSAADPSPSPSSSPSGVLPPSVPPPPSDQPVAPPASYMGRSTGSLSDAGPNVAAASFQPRATGSNGSAAGAPADEVLPPSTTPPPARDSASTLQFNGMHVNDATELDEPKQFNPTGEPVNIASLPDADSATPSFLRFISPKSTPGGSTGTPTPAKPPSGAWQAR